MNAARSCLRIHSLEKWCFALIAFALTSVDAASTSYQYDARGRLKAATNTNGTVTTYTLDAAGNRVSVVTADSVGPSQPVAVASGAAVFVNTYYMLLPLGKIQVAQGGPATTLGDWLSPTIGASDYLARATYVTSPVPRLKDAAP